MKEVLLKNTSLKKLSKVFLRKERKLSNVHLLLTFYERISKYSQMKFQMLHCTFKLFNVHILCKHVSYQVFLTDSDVPRTFGKNYKF